MLSTHLAIVPFGGREQVLEDARRVAAQLTRHDCNLDGQVKLQGLSLPLPRVEGAI